MLFRSLDDTVPADALLAVLKGAAEASIAEIALFDLYRGEGLGEGKKSLAFRVLLQDTQKTLTDADVESALAPLVSAALEKFQAKLRN